MTPGDLWSGGGGAYRAQFRRRRPLRRLLGALAILLACGTLLLLWPAWAEEAPGNCAAVERRAVEVAMSEAAPPAVRIAARALSRQVLDGRLVAPVMRERYGRLPLPVACTLAYARLRWDGTQALGWVAGLRR